MVWLQVTWENILFFKTPSIITSQGLARGAILPFQKLNVLGLRSFSYIECTLWNNLPFNITQIDNLYAFKCTIKNHFINNLM